MDEEAIETIRESSRSILVLNRRKHRDEVADDRRSMSNALRITAETVAHISNKLKTKSAINLPELLMLKNALMDDVSNIETVLQTHGALRGLVREVIGNDVNKQCAATGCCCNLALGDSRACVAVIRAAGPYLITALHNFATELAVTSAWTIGNLAGSGTKACELLSGQGAISELCKLLPNGNEEIREAALYALVHFAYQLQDELSPEHIVSMFRMVPHMNVAVTSQLLFVLSCHAAFPAALVSDGFVHKMLRYLNLTIDKSHPNDNVTYLFRTLANVNSPQVCDIVLSNFVQNNKINVIKKLLDNDNVKDSLLWFLGNAYRLCSKHEFFEKLLK
ncbi:unnamed protein product [Chrysodeixis includens]|uniref:Uncharacterized protein n=1 Tax=Chrysodeixis includens TaxID=689277 RepID=A0A9N8KTK1_CHRIL|nr:unnamed protein product [Chrysodeixis includens]